MPAPLHELDQKLARLLAKARALVELAVIDEVTLSPGATAAELSVLEAHLGFALPPELAWLLRRTNGAKGLLLFFDLLAASDMMPGSSGHERSEALKKSAVDGRPIVPPTALVFADKRGDQPDCVWFEPTPDGVWRVVTFVPPSGAIVDEDLHAFLARLEKRCDWLLEDAGEALRADLAIFGDADEEGAG